MNLASSEIHSPRYIFFVFVYNTYPTYFFCVKSRKVISVKIFLNNNQLHAQNRDWGVGGWNLCFMVLFLFLIAFMWKQKNAVSALIRGFLSTSPINKN